MPRRGQEHHNARLTDADVVAMRKTYQEWRAAGLRKGYRHLARIWQCGVSTARDIVTNRTRINAR